LVEQLAADGGVDRARCYVTGVSLGAIGCWHAAGAPARPFAALIPVSWGIPPVARDVDLPAWVIVGANEHPRVDPEEVERELYAARSRDDLTKLTVDSHGRHGGAFWNRVYGDPAIYSWLIGHRSARP
jgi:predicted peptidase